MPNSEDIKRKSHGMRGHCFAGVPSTRRATAHLLGHSAGAIDEFRAAGQGVAVADSLRTAALRYSQDSGPLDGVKTPEDVRADAQPINASGISFPQTIV